MGNGTIIEQASPAIPWPVTREQESRAKSREEEINMALVRSIKMVNAVVGLLMGSGYTTPTDRTLEQYPTMGL